MKISLSKWILLAGLLIVLFIAGLLIRRGTLLLQPSSSAPSPSLQDEDAITPTPTTLPTAVSSQPVEPSALVVNPTSPLSPLVTESVATVAAAQPTQIAEATNTVIATPDPSLPLPIYTYQVVQTYPHDPNAFTQGLSYQDGFLYEGTGLKGRSSLRKVYLESGKVLEQVNLTPDYFGEGITLWDDRIIQLTWQSQRGFIWEFAEGFKPVKDYTYTTEGWGITHDDTQLIMSDGTDLLYFWDRAILHDDSSEPRQLATVAVRANGQPVVRLNELEYVEGQVFANIWQTDQIARIDPASGNVLGWIDLSGLLNVQERANSDVLNGIAYDDVSNRLFVTGKLWPKLFEITLFQK